MGLRCFAKAVKAKSDAMGTRACARGGVVFLLFREVAVLSSEAENSTSKVVFAGLEVVRPLMSCLGLL